MEAEGYEPQAKLVEVADPTHGPAQRLDFDLTPMQVRSWNDGKEVRLHDVDLSLNVGGRGQRIRRKP